MREQEAKTSPKLPIADSQFFEMNPREGVGCLPPIQLRCPPRRFFLAHVTNFPGPNSCHIVTHQLSSTADTTPPDAVKSAPSYPDVTGKQSREATGVDS